jgi:transposase
MSVHLAPFPALSEDTARIAKSAFRRKANIYLTIGDHLDNLFAQIDFAPLYAADGKPALAPNLLALVVVFQFMENLPDREAADAVRSRIDWKYALHLPLADTGFDDSVLSEFRQRLVAHGTAQEMFNHLLERLKALGLVRKGGKQRTDATYVLAATQRLNRIQLVAETMRLALEALGEAQPVWLRGIALPHWYERYSLVLTGFRLPRKPAEQDALAMDIGRDGFYLLAALAQPDVPNHTASLPAIDVLRQVWQQQFEQGDDGLHWRPAKHKPPAAEVIATPHDSEVRFRSHGDIEWEGYQIHMTESCDPDLPHLITHVAAPSASVGDPKLIPQIHAALQQLDLLPHEHFVDKGYVTGPNLAHSQCDYGVRLVGPITSDPSWQAHLPDGLTLQQFRIDWEQHQAVCPQGQTSTTWREGLGEEGEPQIEIGFARSVCQSCPLRTRCTKSTTGGRTLKLSAYHEQVWATRRYQETDAFKAEYALRAGIEGTISATVRNQGARRTRYIGQAKTEVQALLTAMAVNLRRTALWLMAKRPATTRPPGLTSLAPA